MRAYLVPSVACGGIPNATCVLCPPRPFVIRIQNLGAGAAGRTFPEEDRECCALFQSLVAEGIAAALVVLPPEDEKRGRFLPGEDYYRLKDLAHRAGLPLQILRQGEDPHRVANALLSPHA